MSKAIPYGTVGLTVTTSVSDADVGDLAYLEHVQVTVTITHSLRGDLVVDLVSPSGTTSRLATRRSSDKSAAGLNNWTFTTVRCWGEAPTGVWTLVVHDEFNEAKSGSLVSWRLNLYGTSALPGSTEQRAPAGDPGAPAAPTTARDASDSGDSSPSGAWCSLERRLEDAECECEKDEPLPLTL